MAMVWTPSKNETSMTRSRKRRGLFANTRSDRENKKGGGPLTTQITHRQEIEFGGNIAHASEDTTNFVLSFQHCIFHLPWSGTTEHALFI